MVKVGSSIERWVTFGEHVDQGGAVAVSVMATRNGPSDRSLINMSRMACDGYFLDRAMLPIADGYQVTSLDEPSGDNRLRLAGFYWSPNCFPVAAIALPGPTEVPTECSNIWFNEVARVALGAHAEEVLGAGFDNVFCQMGESGTIVSASLIDEGRIAGPWLHRPRPTQYI